MRHRSNGTEAWNANSELFAFRAFLLLLLRFPALDFFVENCYSIAIIINKEKCVMSDEIKQVEKIAEGTDTSEMQQGEHAEEAEAAQEKILAEASTEPQEKTSAEASTEPQEKVSEETSAVPQEKESGEVTQPKNEEKEADAQEKSIYRKGNPFRRKTYFGDEEEMARDEWILSRLRDEDLMEYLSLEHRKAEMLQKAKETKERRIFFLVQMIVSLAAIVGVVYFLKSEPVVLVNILYITGIVIVLWIWKNPKDKSESKQ